MSKKFVYLFKEGNASMRELLGGKGANLAEMTSLGLPVYRQQDISDAVPYCRVVQLSPSVWFAFAFAFAKN